MYSGIPELLFFLNYAFRYLLSHHRVEKTFFRAYRTLHLIKVTLITRIIKTCTFRQRASPRVSRANKTNYLKQNKIPPQALNPHSERPCRLCYELQTRSTHQSVFCMFNASVLTFFKNTFKCILIISVMWMTFMRWPALYYWKHYIYQPDNETV